MVSRDLERICLNCLEKNPGHRYASAQDLADDLDRFLAGKPVHARRIGPVNRGWRLLRRHPAQLGTLVATALTIGVTAYFTVQNRENSAQWTTRLARLELSHDALWIQRIASIARSPEYPIVIAAAAKARSDERLSARRCYDLACIYSLAGLSASNDARLSEVERGELIDLYRRSALELLTQARHTGYFNSPDRRHQLRQDPELQFLRGNPVFDNLARSLKEDRE
jgi:hypothetical protein